MRITLKHIAVLIFFIILTVLISYNTISERTVIQRDTVAIKYADTTAIKEKFEAELKAKLLTELKPKIIRVKERVDVDSIYKAAKQAALKDLEQQGFDSTDLGSFIYTANADTTIVSEDSSLTIKTSAKYKSRMPLDPESLIVLGIDYFYNKIKEYEKQIITETVEVEKPFYRNIWFYLTAFVTALFVISL